MTVVLIFITLLDWARRCVTITNPEFESLYLEDSIAIYSLKSRATGQGLFIPYGVFLMLIAPQDFQKFKSRTTVICVPLFACFSPTGCYFHLSLELYCFSGEKGNINSLCPWLQREIEIFIQLPLYHIVKAHPVLGTMLSAVKKYCLFNSQDSPVIQLLL